MIDVGGGLRGIYGAGVLDWCLDNGISFDMCIGVSAGAANLSSFMAGQKGRNRAFYMEYAFRKKYMGMRNIPGGGYINLNYIYGTLSNSGGEYPLNFQAMRSSGKKYIAVATNAITGRPKYFDMRDMHQDRYEPIKASSCVPVVNKPYVIGRVPYFDGGMSDPIPVNRAFREGCDKVVIILTRPKDQYRNARTDTRLASVLTRKYPRSAYKLTHRAELYNRQLDLAKRYEARGKVLILSPADISGMRTLKKDRAAMELMYREGYEDAARIADFIR